MNTTSYSPLISKVYKSRNILLEILKTRGYDIDDYTGFSVTEIHTMYNNKQLDMLLTNNDTGKKIYYKYHLSPTRTKLRGNHVCDYIEDLFSISLSDDELNDDTSASDNISGLLNSSMDVFYRTASY